MSNLDVKPKISKKQAQDALWHAGVLSWLLKPHQKSLYELYLGTVQKTNTWLLARRSGKTFTLALIAAETCIKNPNAVVKFVAPTKMQIKTILRAVMKDVLATCPASLQPSYNTQTYTYYFPNGSEIQLAGTDSGHADKLRGGASALCIVDEAQDVTDLEDVIKSVLLPTTLTTKGKILIAGTPPKDPDHDFVRMIEDAERKGTLIKKTIHDNTMLSQEQIDGAIEESGGADTDFFKREYLCEIIKDPKTSVIPEMTPLLEKEIVREWPKPAFYYTYESMDLGFVDLTCILFAYHDFKSDKVIIEDEYVVSGDQLKLPDLVSTIRQKEKELWTSPLTLEVKKPYIRVSDINYIVTSEISRASNKEIQFMATKKDDKEAAINVLRVMLANKKIIIHPRCVNLIRHLRNVKWDSTGKKFARSPDNGHYDCVDAAVYLVRNIIYSKNPYPAHYEMDLRSGDMHIANPAGFESSTRGFDVNNFYKMFNVKTKR